MLLARLIWLIENHAESLTRATLDDLQSNPRTPSFHSIAREEMESRIYSLYRNLGRWIGTRDEAQIENEYLDLGRSRRADGVPLSEIVYAVVLYKEHLRQFIKQNSVLDSGGRAEHEELLPVLLYEIQELNYMVGHFFDSALYHTARGYEQFAFTEQPGRIPVAGPTSGA